ncbi:hypothetical protein K4G64_33895, partial [Streptomyces sp. WAC04114]|nr:hypothetical protein [Streptomyces sp. WAC04114]
MGFLDGGDQVRALDVRGATLTRHVHDGDPDSAGSVFVDTMCKRYGSVRDLLSEGPEGRKGPMKTGGG